MKRLFAVWALLILFVFPAALLAQGGERDDTINANDVDIFVRIANLEKADGPASAKIMADPDRSLSPMRAVRERIATVGTILKEKASDDVARIVLADGGISPAEVGIVKRREDEVIDAIGKYTAK
ncbi:MAG: hypothetical protein LBF58_07990 [Deltaproteobacteria bacterium]|nr:hypothetical protein [Deltaproteobacteria bacterium]